MTIDLNAEQIDAVKRGETVRLVTSGLGEVVIVRASEYKAQFEDDRCVAEWIQLGMESADRWARENPFET